MEKKLKLGKIEIETLEYASRGNALLGIRDSGKSYTATLIAEKLIDAGVPIIAFDPSGIWPFLRVPGAGKGYEVVVAGGPHADFKLSAKTSTALIEAAMNNGISVVFDLSQESKADWRRIVRDGVKLLLQKNHGHGLRHVFLEEAAEFVPQRVIDGDVYAEIEKLARIGGNARLGYTLINQRAEQVNKAVLELCDNLFLHRQKGKNSLASLEKWLDVGAVDNGKEIVKTLATLPTGEAWAWLYMSDTPVRFKAPKKNSFHPDRRVMRGDVKAAKKSVDVGAFVETMKKTLVDVEKEADANDPAKLRAKIAELERQLKAKPPAAVDAKALAKASRDGFEQARKAFRGAADEFAKAVKALAQEAARFDKALRDAKADEPASVGSPALEIRKSANGEPIIIDARELATSEKKARAIARASLTPIEARALEDMTGAERRVANALRFWSSVGQDTPTRPQVGAVAGMSPKSSHFSNTLGSMKTAGLIDYPTKGTVRAIKPIGADMDGDAATNAFRSTLNGTQLKMLDALRRFEFPIDNGKLAEACDMSPTSSHFSNIRGSLRTLTAVEYLDGGTVLTQWARDLLG